jgi:hypothetical protein
MGSAEEAKNVFIKYCYRPILMYRPEMGAQTMAYMNRPAASQRRFLRSIREKHG